MVRLSQILAAVLPLCAVALVPPSSQKQKPAVQLIKTATDLSAPVVESILSSRSSPATLTTVELPEKYYFPTEKETPKVLGGVRIGIRNLCVVTGASSGLGLNCAYTLAKTGRHFVVMACRDVDKAKKLAKKMGFPEGSYTVMKLELASLQSVRDFVANLKAFKSARPLNNLICNAAVYRPTDPEPAWTDDGFEMSMVRSPFIYRCILVIPLLCSLRIL